jgi:hypothetical protein
MESFLAMSLHFYRLWQNYFGRYNFKKHSVAKEENNWALSYTPLEEANFDWNPKFILVLFLVVFFSFSGLGLASCYY